MLAYKATVYVIYWKIIIFSSTYTYHKYIVSAVSSTINFAYYYLTENWSMILKILYKAFCVLKCIPWKSTINCAAPNIALFLIGRSCNHLKDVIISLVYLGQTGSCERTWR